jgi:hypothetical protein
MPSGRPTRSNRRFAAEVSPYLHPGFLPIALGRPVTDPFEAALPTRYWRAKSAVSLLPATRQAVLPAQAVLHDCAP